MQVFSGNETVQFVPGITVAFVPRSIGTHWNPTHLLYEEFSAVWRAALRAEAAEQNGRSGLATILLLRDEADHPMLDFNGLRYSALNRRVMFAADLSNLTCFEELVVGMGPHRLSIFSSFFEMGGRRRIPMQEYASHWTPSEFEGFRAELIHGMGLESAPHNTGSTRLSLMLIVRAEPVAGNRTFASRRLEKQEELLAQLRKHGSVETVCFEWLGTMAQQVEHMLRANIDVLIGVHGSGLSLHALFLPQHSALIELNLHELQTRRDAPSYLKVVFDQVEWLRVLVVECTNRGFVGGRHGRRLENRPFLQREAYLAPFYNNVTFSCDHTQILQAVGWAGEHVRARKGIGLSRPD